MRLYNSLPDSEQPDKRRLYKQLIKLVEDEEEATFKKEVDSRKFGLNAEPYPILCVNVEREIAAKSKLELLYKNLLQLIGAAVTDEVERVRIGYIKHLYKKIPLVAGEKKKVWHIAIRLLVLMATL